MRVFSAIAAFAILMTMATAAKAADPIVGAWKLNTAKSKFAVPPPKEQVEVYRALDSGEIELTLTRIIADGSHTSTTLAWPASGGAVKLRQGSLPEGETLVETLLGPGDWYVTYLQNGKQFLIMHKAISEDGKTMRQTITGIGPQGKPAEQIQVLDRQ